LPHPSDTEIIRNSLTREVTNDAYAISQQIFKGQEPDVARVSNEQLDERYHQAILSGDRNYLMAEAARDPQQFLAATDRLVASGRAFVPPDAKAQPDAPLPRAARPDVPLPKVPPSLQQTFVEPPASPSIPEVSAPPPSTPAAPLAPAPTPGLPPPLV